MRCARRQIPRRLARLVRAACVASLAGLAACATRTHAATATGAEAAAAAPARLQGEAETHWRGRAERDSLERAIASWERAALDEGTARDALLRLAEARHFLGESILVFGWGEPEAAAAAFADGKRAADRALGRAPSEPDAPDEAAPADADPAALYWRARNVQSWAALGDYAREILVTAEVERDLRRAAETDATLDHGGPDRALGVLYAAPPSFARRDLERARGHFDRARAPRPGFLATDVAEAGSLAIAAQDRTRFEDTLRRVLEADLSVAPDVAPENRIAQTRAAALLARADELFE